MSSENATPEVLENIDWSKVIANAVYIRNSIVNGTYHEDNDYKQYVFEEVMQAIFGQNYFDWQNERTD